MAGEGRVDTVERKNRRVERRQIVDMIEFLQRENGRMIDLLTEGKGTSNPKGNSYFSFTRFAHDAGQSVFLLFYFNVTNESVNNMDLFFVLHFFTNFCNFSSRPMY